MVRLSRACLTIDNDGNIHAIQRRGMARDFRKYTSRWQAFCKLLEHKTPYSCSRDIHIVSVAEERAL